MARRFPSTTDTSGDAEALTQVMTSMNVNEEEGPIRRPDQGGTLGERFQVVTNTYEITSPTLVCYHYDVKITSPSEKTDKTPPRLNREIWNFLANEMKVFGGAAVCYDGRGMAYSPIRLPSDHGSWSVLLPDEEGGRNKRDFNITIKFTRPIDLNRLPVFLGGLLADTPDAPDASEIQSGIQALNVLLQHGVMAVNATRGASFFQPPENPASARLAAGLVMWKGFYTSLRLGPERLFLNLDIASQPMIQSGNLPEVILDFLRADSRNLNFGDMSASAIPPQAIIKLNRFLKGLKVKLKCVDADGYQPTRKIRMFEANGASHTIMSYFQTVYNVRLQRPDFPVIAVSKVARWPIEMCEVEAGQKHTKKGCLSLLLLDPDQTAQAIRLTTVAPDKRRQTLAQVIREIQPGKAALEQWGISINERPMEATARQLLQPVVGFSDASMQPQNGVWSAQNHTLFQPARFDRWLVMVFDQERFFTVKEAQNAVIGLVAACEDLGIKIGNHQPEIHYAPRGVDIPSYVRNLGGKMVEEEGGPPELLLCFLPRQRIDAYGEIKRFGDVTMGVATQCLNEMKVKRGNREYFTNIALKLNHKLAEGINSVLRPEDLGPICEKPTMVIGCDVSHANPGSLAPSVAAIVGSMDWKAAVYGNAITVQPSRLEVVANLEKMMLKLLAQFTKKHGSPPERLIFLRDGISEGQFAQVLAAEVTAIRLAAERFGKEHRKEYKPALTFITCGKRHHISLFPRDRQFADPKTGNVKSGTVVDTEVVSPFQFDFYLQAHASLLGTGRSAHYTVLIDDSDFSSDELQKMIFSLCFTYARATRAVSVAAPAFYASRLCTRAQLLLKREDDDATTVISSASGSGSSDERRRQDALHEYQSRLRAIHEVHEERLFWM